MSGSSLPTLLLVAGIPPGRANVGEIFLADVAGAYPGQVAAFATPPGGYSYERPPELEHVPVRLSGGRYSPGPRRWRGRLGSLEAHFDFGRKYPAAVRRLADEAVSFGREHGAEKVLVVLESPTTYGLGLEVADRLGVPLLAIVWDAPEQVVGRLGRLSRRRLTSLFGVTIAHAERVAVVSHAMREALERRWGATCVLLRHGPGEEHWVDPPLAAGTGRFLIGFAGSVHGEQAWKTLFAALDRVGWTIAGRPVRLRLLGSSFRLAPPGPVDVEVLGFQPADERTRLLAECDVHYLPVPFEPALDAVARHSFPAKLSTYLATSRPVLLHAPPGAAVVAFHEEHGVGACCTTLDPADLLSALEPLAAESTLYLERARQAGRVGREHFSTEVFRARLLELVGVAPTPAGV